MDLKREKKMLNLIFCCNGLFGVSAVWVQCVDSSRIILHIEDKARVFLVLGLVTLVSLLTLLEQAV